MFCIMKLISDLSKKQVSQADGKHNIIIGISIQSTRCSSHLVVILLTGYLQRCIPADCLTKVVPGNTDIHPLVGFAPPSMYNAQKEKRPTGQQHPMRSRIFFVSHHPLPILVPLDDGGGTAFCFAVQRSWLTLGHNEVGRVLYYPRRRILKARART